MSNKNQNSGLQPINNFVIFKTESGKVNIDVFYQDHTLWLTQKTIAELFEKGRSTITEHLKKIFEEGELDEKVVCRDFRHTTQHGAIEGKTQDKEVKYYNLRAITAVGYRVNSQRAIEFRKWATEVLTRDFGKGFSVDNLENMRRFYLTYGKSETMSRNSEKVIQQTSSDQFKNKPQTLSADSKNTFSETLSREFKHKLVTSPKTNLN